MEENQSEQQTSPVPSKRNSPEQRTFPEALKWVILGFKITKTDWGDPEYYGVLKDGMLKLHKPDGNFYDWIISEGDMVGEDYILVEDMN